MKLPVAFFVFNRSDVTSRVFEHIRDARPERLFVVADGPREERPDDVEKCAEVRKILDHIDWPCDVHRNYSDGNMGCKKRIVSGMDWVFENVEEAVILEDDCLPDPSFFPFCEELLDRYRDDTRVMSIRGLKMQGGMTRGNGSYFFSAFTGCWGWATWRRAWHLYDGEMADWPETRDAEALCNLLGYPEAAKFWIRCFDTVFSGRIDTWDYQWQYCCWRYGGMSCVPNSSLVMNIGFGPDATHTRDPSTSEKQERVSAMRFPLTHPRWVVANSEAGEHTMECGFGVRRYRSVRKAAAELVLALRGFFGLLWRSK